jgi:hypothetical protein
MPLSWRLDKRQKDVLERRYLKFLAAIADKTVIKAPLRLY